MARIYDKSIINYLFVFVDERWCLSVNVALATTLTPTLTPTPIWGISSAG